MLDDKKGEDEAVFDKGNLFKVDYQLGFVPAEREEAASNDNENPNSWRQLDLFQHWLPRVYMKMQGSFANDNSPEEKD
jgi:hypothetical protein